MKEKKVLYLHYCSNVWGQAHRLHLFDQNTEKTAIFSNKLLFKITFLFYVLKFHLFLPAKLNFQQPLLQASASHDPLEIILICSSIAQETYLLSKLKTDVIFLGKLTFFRNL